MNQSFFPPSIFFFLLCVLNECSQESVYKWNNKDILLNKAFSVEILMANILPE